MADMIDTAAISMEDVSVEMLSGREDALREEMLEFLARVVDGRAKIFSIPLEEFKAEFSL